ncbi:MAG TPA: thioredoxin domain-containing protein [Candidatus Paceibacterota bacterium]|nr:thioredoxin domain-containing protein [Candidatus Paceibacterota bacterium]HMO82557.1 thioredoxin domain-containing protein [Candidatus Paceibacterota bacterium]
MEENYNKNQPNQYLIPLAIVIAGAFVAGALYFSNSGATANAPVAITDTNQPVAAVPEPTGSTDAVRPVTIEDHIKGNPNAPIKIVEYSDFECPFCKRFHDTMNEVMDKYGETGEVAWVFRQFPLEQLHPVKAQRAAVATECAAEQGGNDAFWAIADGYFADPSTGNNRTNQDVLIPELAAAAGLDADRFNECLESGKYDEHIQADIANAVETGGRGTPWSVMIGPDGKTYPINGAQPLAAIEQLISIATDNQ